MAAGGKGHAPRPYSVSADEYASNFDRIFRGVAERSKAAGSNPANTVGSNPTPAANCTDCQAAVYIDPVTGAQVDDAWWPGDPVGYEHG